MVPQNPRQVQGQRYQPVFHDIRELSLVPPNPTLRQFRLHVHIELFAPTLLVASCSCTSALQQLIISLSQSQC